MKVGSPLKGLGIFGDLIFILQRIVVDGNGNIYTHVVFISILSMSWWGAPVAWLDAWPEPEQMTTFSLMKTPRSRTHLQDTEDPRPICDYYSSPSCVLLISHPSWRTESTCQAVFSFLWTVKTDLVSRCKKTIKIGRTNGSNMTKREDCGGNLKMYLICIVIMAPSLSTATTRSK